METYYRNPSSQKTLFDETLTVPIVVRLHRLCQSCPDCNTFGYSQAGLRCASRQFPGPS